MPKITVHGGASNRFLPASPTDPFDAPTVAGDAQSPVTPDVDIPNREEPRRDENDEETDDNTGGASSPGNNSSASERSTPNAIENGETLRPPLVLTTESHFAKDPTENSSVSMTDGSIHETGFGQPELPLI